MCRYTGDKLCDTWGTQFSSSGVLKTYYSICTVEKYFKCDECGNTLDTLVFKYGLKCAY